MATYEVRTNIDGVKTVVKIDTETVETDLSRAAIKAEIANLKLGKQANQDQIAVINARLDELRALLTDQQAAFDEAEGADPEPIP